MKAADDRRPPAKRRARASGERRVRVPRNALLVRFFLHPVGKTILALAGLALVIGIGVFVYYYNVYAKMIDARLRGGPYRTTAGIYASPGSVAVGDKLTPSELTATLRRAGYSENRSNPVGSYFGSRRFG